MMIYFLPAWYHNNEWSEDEQMWSFRKTRSEFDDTVKQIQLFHRSKLHSYVILLLSFAPNFRHFLHRQGTYRARYWSCFDSIQEIRRKKASIFSFHDLAWPAGIEFLYTPFEVLALLNDEIYAKISFGEYGNMIRIDMYSDGVIVRRNIYDDRGFIASTILFNDEQMHHQDYLMENGTWKIRYFYEDGHVEVNPEADKYLIEVDGEERRFNFQSGVYESMELIIEEVFNKYQEFTAGDDIYCVAMHKHHLKLMERSLVGRNIILSFYKERFPMECLDDAERIIEMSDYVVTDSRETRTAITYKMRKVLRNITDITPFDTRVDIGISQQLSIQKIMIPIDDVDGSILDKAIVAVGQYFKKNEYAQVVLFSRRVYGINTEAILKNVQRVLEDNGLEGRWAIPENMRSDDELEEEVEKGKDESRRQRFFVETCVSEVEISKCFRELRLFLDIADIPDMYLQILAVSVCIPQIVRTKTRYIEDGKNGKVLDNLDNLNEWLEYYLDGLANWNEAAVQSYDIGQKFSTKVLINKWKGVIRSIG